MCFLGSVWFFWSLRFFKGGGCVGGVRSFGRKEEVGIVFRFFAWLFSVGLFFWIFAVLFTGSRDVKVGTREEIYVSVLFRF